MHLPMHGQGQLPEYLEHPTPSQQSDVNSINSIQYDIYLNSGIGLMSSLMANNDAMRVTDPIRIQ